MTPFGFWTVDALNVSLCAVPKGGSTMNRQIVARAAGLLDTTRCFFGWSDTDNDLLSARGVHQMYSPTTTNIAIVRDPWERAVSSFADQIARRYLPNNTSHEAFLQFLQTSPQDDAKHHTGLASRMCLGMHGARFDYLIDLGDVASFARVARMVPSYGAIVDHGWEACTGGEPRLYMPGSIATHKNKERGMASRLCTRAAIGAVCERYAADYAMYERLGHPFPCACGSRVVPA